MHRFLIVVERAGRGYSAYSPDLPGCVATGKTHDEVTRHMAEGIQMHLQGMREDKLPVPRGRASAEKVDVAKRSSIPITRLGLLLCRESPPHTVETRMQLLLAFLDGSFEEGR